MFNTTTPQTQRPLHTQELVWSFNLWYATFYNTDIPLKVPASNDIYHLIHINNQSTGTLSESKLINKRIIKKGQKSFKTKKAQDVRNVMLNDYRTKI